jgi:hypothetical protein
VGVRFSAYERGFLEALIDGEGSLIAAKERKTGRVHLRVTIANNSLELLHKAQEIVDGGYIIEKKSKKKSNKLHSSYELRFSHNIIRELLPQLRFSTKEKEVRRKAFLRYLEAENRSVIEADLFTVIRDTSHNKRLTCA